MTQLPRYLAKVKVVERSTEGLRSIIKRTLQRSPNASASYLSVELRFGQLMSYAISNPRLFKEIETEFQNMGTLKGYRETVLKPGFIGPF